MNEVETAAKAAYAAYGKFLRDRGLLGRNTAIPWEDISQRLREAWIEAAKAARAT
jgi:hypothetical protein